MAKSAEEMRHWAEYDYVIVNDTVEDSVAEVRAIVAAERLRRERQPRASRSLSRACARTERCGTPRLRGRPCGFEFGLVMPFSKVEPDTGSTCVPSFCTALELRGVEAQRRQDRRSDLHGLDRAGHGLGEKSSDSTAASSRWCRHARSRHARPASCRCRSRLRRYSGVTMISGVRGSPFGGSPGALKSLRDPRSAEDLADARRYSLVAGDWLPSMLTAFAVVQLLLSQISETSSSVGPMPVGLEGDSEKGRQPACPESWPGMS